MESTPTARYGSLPTVDETEGVGAPDFPPPRSSRARGPVWRPSAQLGRRDSLGYIVNSHGELIVPHMTSKKPQEAAKRREEEDVERERWRLNGVAWLALGLLYLATVALLLDRNTKYSDLPPMWRHNSKEVQVAAYVMLAIALGSIALLLLRAMARRRTLRPWSAVADCTRRAQCCSRGYAKMAIYGSFCVIIFSTLPYFVWYAFSHKVKPHLVVLWTSGIFALLATVLSAQTMWGHIKYGRPQRMQVYIVRILLMVPIYAITCFMSLRFFWYGVYLTTLRELYEAFTLFNFVKFLVTYLDRLAVKIQFERDEKRIHSAMDMVQRELSDSSDTLGRRTYSRDSFLSSSSPIAPEGLSGISEVDSVRSRASEIARPPVGEPVPPRAVRVLFLSASMVQVYETPETSGDEGAATKEVVEASYTCQGGIAQLKYILSALEQRSSHLETLLVLIGTHGLETPAAQRVGWALTSAGLPELHDCTRVSAKGLRTELEQWIWSAIKRDPEFPCEPPLCIESYFVIQSKADESKADEEMGGTEKLPDGKYLLSVAEGCELTRDDADVAIAYLVTQLSEHGKSLLHAPRDGIVRWRELALRVKVLRFMGALRKYKGQSYRAESLVLDHWKDNNYEPLRHLPPLCCFKVQITDKYPKDPQIQQRFSKASWDNSQIARDTMGRHFLHYFRQGTLQYVSVQCVLSILTIIMQTQGTYHEGSLSPRSGYLYVAFVRNLSQSWALYTLLIFYKQTRKLLSPVRPVPKFMSVKAIVFFTFWQQCALVLLHTFDVLPMEEVFARIYLHDHVEEYINCKAHGNYTFSKSQIVEAMLQRTMQHGTSAGAIFPQEAAFAHEDDGSCFWLLNVNLFGLEVDSPAEFSSLAIGALQNMLVCFEMFIAAVCHHFVFPAKHFGADNVRAKSEAKRKKESRLKTMFDWRDTGSEVYRFWWTERGRKIWVRLSNVPRLASVGQRDTGRAESSGRRRCLACCGSKKTSGLEGEKQPSKVTSSSGAETWDKQTAAEEALLRQTQSPKQRLKLEEVGRALGMNQRQLDALPPPASSFDEQQTKLLVQEKLSAIGLHINETDIQVGISHHHMLGDPESSPLHPDSQFERGLFFVTTTEVPITAESAPESTPAGCLKDGHVVQAIARTCTTPTSAGHASIDRLLLTFPAWPTSTGIKGWATSTGTNLRRISGSEIWELQQVFRAQNASPSQRRGKLSS
jgi:hypothetical protein